MTEPIAGQPTDPPPSWPGRFAPLAEDSGEPDRWSAPARRLRLRRRLIILLVALVVLAAGGGAGYLLTRDTSRGQATAADAVDGFLTAAYSHHDAVGAARYVCATSRDTGKLTTKINEITRQDSGYGAVQYSWSTPAAERAGADEAVLTTTVTLRTGNEQKATQRLRITATRHNGWWVCEIQQSG